MKETTSRFRTQGGCVEEHNDRDSDLIRQENAKHENRIIDLDGSLGGFHETWLEKTLEEVYEENFGEAIAEYNAKQKRKDRQKSVKSYMDEVKNDTRGKENKSKTHKGKYLVYEHVVSFGNVKEPIPLEDQYTMLLEYAQRYQQENPNMAVVRMDLHGDEFYRNSVDEPWRRSTLHLHIDDVPVATGYKQGLSVQSSFGKALNNMGYHSTQEQVLDEDGEPKLDETTGKPIYRKVTESEHWENRQREILEEIALEHGYTLKHPYKGKNVDSLTAQQYADLEQAKTHLEEQADDIQEQTWEINAKKRNLERDQRKLIEAEISLNEEQYAIESMEILLEDKVKILVDRAKTVKERSKELEATESALKAERYEFEDYKKRETQKIQEQQGIIDKIQELYEKSKSLFLKLTNMSDIFLTKYADGYGREIGNIKKEMDGLSL